jgi:hypothetical protein
VLQNGFAEKATQSFREGRSRTTINDTSSTTEKRVTKIEAYNAQINEALIRIANSGTFQ